MNKEYKIIGTRFCLFCGTQMNVYNNHPNKRACSPNCLHKIRRRERMSLSPDYRFSIDKSIDDIFEGVVAKFGNSQECWVYPGRATRGGYKQIWNGEKKVMAHKFSYEKYNGIIPEGLVVRHKCDNPPCVNPNHLELGTAKDNSQDMVNRGRSMKGMKHPMVKLTDFQVKEVRSLKGKMLLREVAERFGVGTSQVHRIQNNQSRSDT